MKRIIGNVITVILVIIIIFMSVLLLSHNEYQVSQFGSNTLLIVDEDMLDYKSGSLLIVSKKSASNIQAGDYIFYYDQSSSKVKPVLGLVNDIFDVSFGQYSFKVNNDVVVDEEDIIGRANDTKEYKGLGKILSVLESKYGNLFLVVLPAFLLFMYELINFIVEARSKRNG